MKVEIGAFVKKEYGHTIKEKVSQLTGVDYVFYATGRTNDLFEEKQFGSFGEVAIVTIVVEDEQKESVFDKLFELCDLHQEKNGIIYMGAPITKCSVLIVRC